MCERRKVGNPCCKRKEDSLHLWRLVKAADHAWLIYVVDGLKGTTSSFDIICVVSPLNILIQDIAGRFFFGGWVGRWWGVGGEKKSLKHSSCANHQLKEPTETYFPRCWCSVLEFSSFSLILCKDFPSPLFSFRAVQKCQVFSLLWFSDSYHKRERKKRGTRQCVCAQTHTHTKKGTRWTDLRWCLFFARGKKGTSSHFFLQNLLFSSSSSSSSSLF